MSCTEGDGWAVSRPVRPTIADGRTGCLTLSDMDSKQRRPFTVRLNPAGHDEVLRLAREETEGNASQMVRKLLGEALDARRKRGAR